jgi:hypothetical protein
VDIDLLTRAGERVATLDGYEQIEWTRRYHVPGTFKLATSFHANGADRIAKGLLIRVDGSTYHIEQIHRRRAGRIHTVEASGRDLSRFMQRRICEVDIAGGQSHDVQSGVPAETAMHYYVRRNATAPIVSAKRKVPNLVHAPDQARGGLVQVRARYQPLTDVEEMLGVLHGLGYEVVFDPANGQRVFTVVRGRDLTRGDAKVVFDADLDSALALELLSTDLEKPTYATVAGQGEGAQRQIQRVWLGAVEPDGDERDETFIDARDTDDAATQRERARAQLQEADTKDAFEIDVNLFGSFRYRTSWDLGDVVLGRAEEWGIEQPTRIVGVDSRLGRSQGSTLQRKVVLDTPFPSLPDRIRVATGGGVAAGGSPYE